MTYRPDIDGLRAIAVLSVVLCHADLALPGGYVGVDVFFVISGYLIAGRMLADLEQGTFSLAHFWERRIRRILPALFVVVLASLISGWFFLIPRVYEMLGRSVVNLMLLQSNIFFSRQTSYFAFGNDEQPLLHTWSLSVEEQFYLIIPLLFWAGLRLRRRTWIGPAIGILAAISFAYSVYGTATWVQNAYFALSTRAWELLAGVLTALLTRSILVPATRRISAGMRELAAVLGLASIALPCFLYDSHTPFPGWAALPPVLGTVLLIVLGGRDARATWTHRLLMSRSAVAIGLISYSLYLWHWPLISILKHHSSLLLTTSGRWALVIASLVLAAITYRFVECPFRRGNLLTTRPRLIVATVCTVAGLFISGQLLRLSHGVVERLPEMAQLYARTGVGNNYWNREHRAKDLPHNLLRFGDRNAQPTLLVWGDSHAGSVMPAIDEMCLTAGIAGQLAMQSATPPIVDYRAPLSADVLAIKNDFSAAVLRYAKSGEIDTVLMIGYWHYYSPWGPRFAEPFLQTIDELLAAGCRVYVMKDVPCYKFDVAASLVLYEWRGMDTETLSLSLAEYQAQYREFEELLPRLTERGVTILDPIPSLRAGSTDNTILLCDAGGAFYRDSNHLSVHGAEVIRSTFTPIIDELAQSAARQKQPGSVRSIRTAEAPHRDRR